MSWPANRPPASDDDDAEAGIVVTDAFERFEQRNDIFNRAFWDDTVRNDKTYAFFKSYRADVKPRRGDGFSQRDFALRNASWLISDIITARSLKDGEREGFQAPIRADTPVAPQKIEVEDPAEQAREIKRIAKFFGADLCGITGFDERWIYSARVDIRDFSSTPNELPEGITSVIVMGHEMDAGLTATYPSALAGSATGREYSHEAAIVMQVAAFIRNLGYEAIPSMNDTGLAIPYAIKAGLGEYGRNQMVITPEFGPRVRFSKIFTSLPLEHDAPRRLGVTEVCNICTRCADACPVKALPFGAPAQEEGRSVQKGVVKWTSDAEACFGYWATLSSDCAICMRVCPFNRNYRKLRDRIWRWLAFSRLRRLALWLDDRSGRSKRVKPRTWWAKMRGRD